MAAEGSRGTSPIASQSHSVTFDREALRLVARGRAFDLDIGHFTGMPGSPLNPPFLLTTYRTPQGLLLQQDQPLMSHGQNSAGIGLVTELMVSCLHTGTHIDALCHVTTGGQKPEWHDGVSVCQNLGDFGAFRDDAAAIPAFILKGCLLDVPRALGVDALPAGSAVGRRELEQAEALLDGGVEGGAVLVRTGNLANWPNMDAMADSDGAGVNVEGAKWLVEDRGAILVGADTPAFEQMPSAVNGHPAPVHEYLLFEKGVHIIEGLRLEELAQAKPSHFLFICIAPSISGASGSFVRPVAVT